MEILKQTIISPMTTDGQPMRENEEYVFWAYEKSLCGTYKGLGNRGALKFQQKINDVVVTFNVAPQCIKAIYSADINLNTNTSLESEVE